VYLVPTAHLAFLIADDRIVDPLPCCVFPHGQRIMCSMNTDAIEAIGIDDHGSLWVKPTTSTFPYIYREAMEVHWDAARSCLFSPKPRDWSYVDWFRQIRAAARNQGVMLHLVPRTSWSDVDPDLQHALALVSETGLDP
jgi:hypothetical protein